MLLPMTTKKKLKSNKLRKFKSNGYRSLNQINSNSLDEMFIMERVRCLIKYFNTKLKYQIRKS